MDTGVTGVSASTVIPLFPVNVPLIEVPSANRHSLPPSYIALFGHSGSQAPQLIHSSVIFIAIMINYCQELILLTNLYSDSDIIATIRTKFVSMKLQERINLLQQLGNYMKGSDT